MHIEHRDDAGGRRQTGTDGRPGQQQPYLSHRWWCLAGQQLHRCRRKGRPGQREHRIAAKGRDAQEGHRYHHRKGRSRMYAQQPRIGQWIAGECLHQHPGRAQRRAHHDGQRRARYPVVPDDLGNGGIGRVPQRMPDVAQRHGARAQAEADHRQDNQQHQQQAQTAQTPGQPERAVRIVGGGGQGRTRCRWGEGGVHERYDGKGQR